MKFLIDADVPRSVAKLLYSKSHDVLDIRDVTPFDVSDSAVYRLTKEQGRILITRDLDFSNILLYPPPANAGIIVLRTHLLTVAEILEIVTDLLERIPEKDFLGSLTVARKGRYRIRRASRRIS
jgi:predicted nuclease of predicted toxin-antitoxin system